jgi:tetratricopeptide (TPR) repeat protein
MAKVYFIFDWDWSAAAVEIQKARQLDPLDGDAIRLAGVLAKSMGRLDEASGLFQQAISLDPLSATNYVQLAEANADRGNYAAAELGFRKGVELAPPSGFGGRAALAELLLATGKPAEALTSFEGLEDEDARLWGRAMAYFALGRKSDSERALADLENRFASDNAYSIALVHAYCGEIDQSFAWLDRAYAHKDLGLIVIKTDPFLQNLRGDPRYKLFLRKMNLLE